MFGRLTPILFIALLLFVMTTALPAFASDQYLLYKDYPRYNSNIVIHLIEVNVSDKYMGNVFPSKPVEDTQWAHLIYQYENLGDKQETGHIQFDLIATDGTVYTFNPNQDEYSGVVLGPHSKSDLRWHEMPVPRGMVFTKIHVYEGTNPNFLLKEETYDLQRVVNATVTATAVPSGVLPTVTKFGCCTPLLPFLLIGSLAVVGLYTKGKGIKK